MGFETWEGAQSEALAREVLQAGDDRRAVLAATHRFLRAALERDLDPDDILGRAQVLRIDADGAAALYELTEVPPPAGEPLLLAAPVRVELGREGEPGQMRAALAVQRWDGLRFSADRDGFRAWCCELMRAARRGDGARLDALAEASLLADPRATFAELFGEARAEQMAARYERLRRRGALDLRRRLAHLPRESDELRVAALTLEDQRSEPALWRALQRPLEIGTLVAAEESEPYFLSLTNVVNIDGRWRFLGHELVLLPQTAHTPTLERLLAEGLEVLARDFETADALLAELRLPAPRRWFVESFGAELGEPLADEYEALPWSVVDSVARLAGDEAPRVAARVADSERSLLAELFGHGGVMQDYTDPLLAARRAGVEHALFWRLFGALFRNEPRVEVERAPPRFLRRQRSVPTLALIASRGTVGVCVASSSERDGGSGYELGLFAYVEGAWRYLGWLGALADGDAPFSSPERDPPPPSSIAATAEGLVEQLGYAIAAAMAGSQHAAAAARDASMSAEHATALWDQVFGADRQGMAASSSSDVPGLIDELAARGALDLVVDRVGEGDDPLTLERVFSEVRVDDEPLYRVWARHATAPERGLRSWPWAYRDGRFRLALPPGLGEHPRAAVAAWAERVAYPDEVAPLYPPTLEGLDALAGALMDAQGRDPRHYEFLCTTLVLPEPAAFFERTFAAGAADALRDECVAAAPRLAERLIEDLARTERPWEWGCEVVALVDPADADGRPPALLRPLAVASVVFVRLHDDKRGMQLGPLCFEAGAWRLLGGLYHPESVYALRWREVLAG